MDRHGRYGAFLRLGRLLRPDRGDRLLDRPEGAGKLAGSGDRRRRFAVDQSFDRPHGGEILALDDAEHDRHGAARRQPGHIAALGIDAETLLDRKGDPMQVLGFAAALVNVLVEPETPAVRIAKTVETGDEGKHGDEAVALRQFGEGGFADHVLIGLRTAMKDHDHGNRALAGETVGDEDAVVPGTGVPVRTRLLPELFQAARVGRRRKPGKNHDTRHKRQ
jgi:hypothetical protein